jgi:hypothetical protein
MFLTSAYADEYEKPYILKKGCTFTLYTGDEYSTSTSTVTSENIPGGFSKATLQGNDIRVVIENCKITENENNVPVYEDIVWVEINGEVTYDGEPLCAMILANGQNMFSCDPIGKYTLNVPLNEDGQIVLFAFCEGLQPFKMVLDEWETEYDIEMFPCP